MISQLWFDRFIGFVPHDLFYGGGAKVAQHNGTIQYWSSTYKVRDTKYFLLENFKNFEKRNFFLDFLKTFFEFFWIFWIFFYQKYILYFYFVKQRELDENRYDGFSSNGTAFALWFFAKKKPTETTLEFALTTARGHVYRVVLVPFDSGSRGSRPRVKRYMSGRSLKTPLARASRMSVASLSTTHVCRPSRQEKTAPNLRAHFENVKCSPSRLTKGKQPTIGSWNGPGMTAFCTRFFRQQR